nr:adhesion G protein-coupled receptor F5-like [Danio rerio]|eukprot:XP_021334147.1 adhesion G protein-coupled receptor F5-like [Danio rerio]
MSLSLKETFDANLHNVNSDKFKKYKSDIEKAISESYKGVKGFISATVTGFRPGSVVVDFFITSSTEVAISVETSQAIVTNMQDLKYTVDTASVAQSENIKLSTRDSVFPEEDMTLSCQANNAIGNIDWRFQGTIIQPKPHHVSSADNRTLTVKSVDIRDNGRYECLFNTDKGPHIFWETIDYIKPYPAIQLTSNKTYECNGQSVELKCCVSSDYSVQWMQETQILISNTDSQNCISFTPQVSCGKTAIFICKLTNADLYRYSYSSRAAEVSVSSPIPQVPNSPATCKDVVFGFGIFGDPPKKGDCDQNQVGFKIGVCGADGNWQIVTDNCVLRIINVLSQESTV